jgi:hypothetical protein
MRGDRTRARVAGACFLIAMVASLAGAAILEPLLGAPELFPALREAGPFAVAGIALELVNAIAVILIAAAMFPILKRRHEGAAMAYFGLRIVESMACVLAAFMPIVLLALGNKVPDLSGASSLLLALRAGSANVLVVLFFCVGALVLYSLLLRTRIVPGFIAVWGLAAAVLIAASNILPAGSAFLPALALPIIANEVFLGIWLIAKGFDAKAESAG